MGEEAKYTDRVRAFIEDTPDSRGRGRTGHRGRLRDSVMSSILNNGGSRGTRR